MSIDDDINHKKQELADLEKRKADALAKEADAERKMAEAEKQKQEAEAVLGTSNSGTTFF